MKKKCIIKASILSCYLMILFFSGHPVQAAGNTPAPVSDSLPAAIPEIDNAVHAFMAANNVPGLSLAITRYGQLVYVKGYGFADREKNQRVTPNSLFRIASISKPVTSIAIMKLMEEKKLRLDDKVFGAQGILKTQYGTKPYTSDITAITIRMLLQHLAGGWGNSKNDPMFTDTSRSIDQLITYTLDSFPLQRKPGTQYDYSNFGYCVLGRVIEKITGKTYEAYVQEAILKPAGITAMTIGGNSLAARKPDEVVYYMHNRANPYCCNVTRMDAHGGWIASATDLVKLLARVDGDTMVKDMLSPASIKAMVTPPAVSPGYACGWGVDSLGNWQHGGSLPGTRTELRKRSNGFGYAVLTNIRIPDTGFNKGFVRLMNHLQQVTNFSTATKVTTPVKSFQPAIFTDDQRIEKLKATHSIVDKMVKDFAEERRIPGIAFGLVGADGTLLYSSSHGFSDVEKKIPVSSTSVYRIASMTKSFAAMGILVLRDAGKLQLDDPVSKYIPEINHIHPLTDDSPPITIRHLLSHTAGFPEDNPWADRQLQKTDEEFLEFLKKGTSLSNTPGMGFEYSNLGFAMLGVIITRVSGEHYEQFIRKHIFQPLGMNHTYWEYEEAPANKLVHGYRLENGKWVKQEMLHSGAYGVMGGLLTTIEDFAKYMNFHLAAWPARSGGDTLFLKRSTIREMHLPSHLSSFLPAATRPGGIPCPRVGSYNFGLGWSKDCRGIEQIAHSGGLPGFGTQWTMLPQYGVAVVCFANLTYSGVTALNTRIVDTLLSLANLKPLTLQPSAILEQRKKELMALLPDWKNAAASGIFAVNFFDDYFIDSLRKQCTALFKKAGKVIGVSAMQPDNELRGNFVIECEKASLLVRFTLSPEDPALIQYFSIRELSNEKGKYGLSTLSSLQQYKQYIAQHPAAELVNLEKFIPGIKLDIRYAQSNNLMKRPVYKTAAAYLSRPAAEALKRIQEELKPMGYGLKVFDGYRPYAVTITFYESVRDSVFAASPYTGSRHNRGCAVDLTLIDLATGKELDMPTPYDSFTKEASAYHTPLPPQVLKNRELLQRVMLKHGFHILPSEWWHFDYGGWDNFPVFDIQFETLAGQ